MTIVYNSINDSKKNNKANKNTRHKFLVTKYNQLLKSKDIDLKQAADVRKIYDELLNGEIDNNDLPDGNIFRKDSVTVFKRDGKGTKVHEGIVPESMIIMQINNLLNYINADDNTNKIVKIAVAHYYFGYIHPFYDGNGRINRFISSYLLSKYENVLLSFKLSKKIKDDINLYNDAFKITNNKLNKGEATFFVKMFVYVLYKAANEIYEELQYYEKRLDNFFNIFNQENYSNLTEIEINILFMLYQSYLCKENAKKGDIVKYLKKNDSTVTKLLEKLDDKNFIIYKKREQIKLSDSTIDKLEIF